MTLIYTIGYEGTDIERFVATLKIVVIKHLSKRLNADSGPHGLRAG